MEPPAARAVRAVLCTAAALSMLAPALCAQVRWVRLYPATSPPGRVHHAMAHHTATGDTVVFGGEAGPFANLGDTWLWDGADWTDANPTTAPSARQKSAMAYVALRGETVLFGGRGGSQNPLAPETWIWNGSNWQLRAVASPPPARYEHDMAYDALRGVVVLYGGRDGSGGLRDTWEWDGRVWTERTAAHAPNAATDVALAYDAARGRVVLFGGVDLVGNLLDETWEWDGSDWTRRTPAFAPSARETALAYDAARERVVMYGGAPWAPVLDTFEWDGSTWTLVASAPRQGEQLAKLAYDTGRARVVSFGGTPFLDVTWEYVADPVASFTTFGQGCLGTAGVPALSAPSGQVPVVGETIAFALTSLPPSAAAFGLVGCADAMLPLDVIGMTGCTLLVRVDATIGIPTLNGRGAWLFRVPNLPGLSGTDFFVQGAIADPGANAVGLTMTNGGAATIGVR